MDARSSWGSQDPTRRSEPTADIGHDVYVVGNDPHGFDGDNDGWGCESYG